MTPLSEQIMDELMDAPMSIRTLSEELGATYEWVRQVVRKLEGKGLIYAVDASMVRGKPEVLYAMAKTVRGAA